MKIDALVKLLLVTGTFLFCFGAGPVLAGSSGVDWVEPQGLGVGPEVADSRIRVATDGSGKAVAVWMKNPSEAQEMAQVTTAYSADSGNTWGPAKVISGPRVPETRMLSSDVCYAGNGTWISIWVINRVVTYTVPSPSTANIQDVYVARSTDGHTWSEPEIAVTGSIYRQVGSGLSVSDADIDANGQGTVIATFESHLVRSGDFGLTWTHSQTPVTSETYAYHGTIIEREIESKIGYCEAGNWVHVFSRQGFFPFTNQWTKIYYSTSSDNGQTWSDAALVNGYRMSLNTSRVIGDMATDGSRVIVTHHLTDSLTTVKTFVSNDCGISWSAGAELTPEAVGPLTAVSLALKGNNAILLVDTPYGPSEDIYGWTSTDGGNTWGGLTAFFSRPFTERLPSIVAGAGENQFLAAFEIAGSTQGMRVDRDVQSAVTLNGGNNWTFSAPVNPEAEPQYTTFAISYPQVASGQNGRMVAIWRSDEVNSLNPVKVISFASSDDYGRTWKNISDFGPYIPPTTDVIDAIVKPGIAHIGGQRWFAYWTDASGTFGVTSSNNDVTWSAPQNLGTRSVFTVMATAPNGTLFARFKTETGYGYLRSDDFGQSWLDVTGDGFGQAVVFAGSAAGINTWYKIDDGISYTSNDNGVSWAQTGALNLPDPAHEISLKVGPDGVVVAAIKTGADCISDNWCSGEIFVARSDDAGSSWDVIPVFEADYVYQMVGFESNVRLQHLGVGRWVLIYGSQKGSQSLHQSVSNTNGLTWSTPAPISEDSWDPGVHSIAGQNGFAVIVGTPGVGNETGIHYTFNVAGLPAAAQDWQLFE